MIENTNPKAPVVGQDRPDSRAQVQTEAQAANVETLPAAGGEHCRNCGHTLWYGRCPMCGEHDQECGRCIKVVMVPNAEAHGRRSRTVHALVRQEVRNEGW